jgi:gamma-glutamyltranspeptidase/glutathione hydrolase
MTKSASCYAPYPEPPFPQREVVCRNGIVAACDSRAADFGLEVLKRGGNAVDAAVVTGFLMMVYEPFSCGLGGHGGHMAFYDGRTGELVGIDASSKAPAEATPDMFVDELLEVPEFYGDVHRVKVKRDANALGFRAMFAPTTVAQYHYVLERWGTLPWDEALAPAIKVAEEGFVADHIYTRRMNDTLKLLQEHGDDALTKPFMDTFFPEGAPLTPGMTIYQRDMAKTLRRLAKEGPQLFYGGEVSDQIVSWVRKHGGILSEVDFTSYKVEAGPMHVSRYRDYDIYGYANSANGSTIAAILNVLDQYDLRSMGYLSPESLHTIAEAMKLAFIDRYAYVSDRDHVPVPYDGLMSPVYARERAKEIDPERARMQRPGDPWRHQASGKRIFEKLGVDVDALTGGAISAQADRDTTFMVAADEDRNIMMITSSNFSNCKVVVPGLGFQLNNSMEGANPVPGHALSIAPFKRILRNSGPTLVFKDGKPVMALSAPGGRKIITGTVMALINALDYGMGVQAALDAPRLHCEAHDLDVTLEDGIPAATLEALRAMGHQLKVTPMYQEPYGRMQSIGIDVDAGLYFGGSEPRSHSGVRGY